MQIKLRDYQEKAHELTIENFRKNKKVILVVMAGGGKSITAGSFIAKYYKHYKFVLIVRKRDLVEQLAKDALETFNLDYGIFMANHSKYDLNKSIQVCSKDTMQARDILPFEGEENIVVMIDECDEFKSYQKEIIARYEKSNRFFYFGMTATPYNQLDHFDVAIQPITPLQLLQRKILVSFKYYIPKQIDYDDIEIKNGKFNAGQLQKKFDSPKAIAESFNAWLMYGENRQTIVFSTNRSHSINTKNYINNYYNKEIAIHIDGKTSSEVRQKAIEDFTNGKIRFILVVGLLKRGTNIPIIGCILDQAPTLSVNNHIQKLGRGSRQNEAYDDCLLIDVANNLMINGGFYQEREIDLTSSYKKTKSDLYDLAMRVCDKCFRADESKAFINNICPYCGHNLKPIKVKKLSKYAKDKLFMESATEQQIENKKMINDYKKTLWIFKNTGRKYQHDIAVFKTHNKLLKKYGTKKLIRVAKNIKLLQSTVDKFNKNIREEYKPLGGLKL